MYKLWSLKRMFHLIKYVWFEKVCFDLNQKKYLWFRWCTVPPILIIWRAADVGLVISVELLLEKNREYFANFDKWRQGYISLRDRRYLAMKWHSEANKEYVIVGKWHIINDHEWHWKSSGENWRLWWDREVTQKEKISQAKYTNGSQIVHRVAMNWSFYSGVDIASQYAIPNIKSRNENNRRKRREAWFRNQLGYHNRQFSLFSIVFISTFDCLVWCKGWLCRRQNKMICSS